MSQEIPRFRINDTAKPLLATLQYRNEADTGYTVLDLTGATSVKFSMYDMATGTVKVDESAATIDTALDGTVRYSWASADVDTAGQFTGFFTVYTSTVTDTYPVKVRDLLIKIDGDTETAEEAYTAAVAAL